MRTEMGQNGTSQTVMLMYSVVSKFSLAILKEHHHERSKNLFWCLSTILEGPRTNCAAKSRKNLPKYIQNIPFIAQICRYTAGPLMV
jgi:hypothetical protein